MKTTSKQKFTKMAIENIGPKTDWKIDLGNSKSKINQLFWNWVDKSNEKLDAIARRVNKAQLQFDTVLIYEDKSAETEFNRIIRRETLRFQRWQQTAARWMKRAVNSWAGAPEWEACFELNSLNWYDLF